MPEAEPHNLSTFKTFESATLKIDLGKITMNDGGAESSCKQMRVDISVTC